MNKLIFCDELVIPVDKLLWMEWEDGRWRIVISIGDNDIKSFHVTHHLFMQLKESVLQTDEKEKRIRELEEKVQLLQTHISLMPGGTEYLLAKQDFQSNV